MLLRVIVSVLLLTGSTATAAQTQTLTTYGFKSADELYRQCSDTEDRTDPVYIFNSATCLAYLTGISDMSPVQTLLAYRRTRDAAAPFCIPIDATPFDLRSAVLDWFAIDEKHRQGGAVWAVVLAFSARWPCTGKDEDQLSN